MYIVYCIYYKCRLHTLSRVLYNLSLRCVQANFLYFYYPGQASLGPTTHPANQSVHLSTFNQSMSSYRQHVTQKRTLPYPDVIP